MEPKSALAKTLATDIIADEDGASAAEYAVLTALVVAAVAAAIAVFDLNVFFGVRDVVLKCVAGDC